MITRLRHLRLALTCLPGLITSRRRRMLLAEMRALCRDLPHLLQQPIPQAMARLTPPPQTAGPPSNPQIVRKLADLAALLERRSPLGLCLRRSLVRYHYLRRLNVPVVVRFGAKFVPKHGPKHRPRHGPKHGPGNEEKDITGHAWLTLDGRPYFEDEENWRDFTVMISWPEPSSSQIER